MQVKSIKSIKNLVDKRVMIRCDFDLPLKNGTIQDDSRLKKILPTIKYLLKKKAKLILVGHAGRPHGRVVKELSLKPVKNKLEKLLNQKIDFIRTTPPASASPQAMRAGGKKILMLENIRFFSGEEKNSKTFAKKLASLADIYVNEAFAVSHRSVASVDAIQDYLPSYAGLHLEEEIKNLSAALKNPKHPVILIIGGAKIETKLPVIKKFQKIVDQILVGGVVANTFLKAQGVEVGKSLADDYLDEAKSMLNLKIKNQDAKLQLKIKNYNLFSAEGGSASGGKNYKIKNLKIILPIDWRVKNDKILDIGQKTIRLFNDIIKKAKTIVWNGPMGKFEEKEFAIGTQEIAKEILKSKAKAVIGGGDTDKILQGKKFGSNIFVSAGGGAMLEFLAGKRLPGFKRIF